MSTSWQGEDWFGPVNYGGRKVWAVQTLPVQTLRSLAADIKAAWDNDERTRRDGQSGQRKRERSDRGQKHSEAKRRFESHLSEGDVAALCDGMASAGSKVMRSQGNCNRVCVGHSSKLEIRRGLLLAPECN